jgi:hypothetical protein
MTLFGLTKIPVPNTVRNILDGISTHFFNIIYLYIFMQIYPILFKKHQIILPFDNRPIIAIDATQYHSSRNIYCGNCCIRVHNKGTDNVYTEYCEFVLLALLISKSYNTVLPVSLEFIVNLKNCYDKQDCEVNAAKRMLPQLMDRLQKYGGVFLGDDLYSHQSVCQIITSNPMFDYIFTCKDDSHKALKSFIDNIEFEKLTVSKKLPGHKTEIREYKWINGVPIRDGKDAERTNFVEAKITTTTVSNAKNKTNIQIFKNITSINITKTNVADIINCGRSRWDIENRAFNIMKNQGYALEHNYGHGKKTLASVLVCLCILAFCIHIVANISEQIWINARKYYETDKMLFFVMFSILMTNIIRSFADLFYKLNLPNNIRPSPG